MSQPSALLQRNHFGIIHDMLLSLQHKPIKLVVRTRRRKYLLWIGVFLLIFFVLPNIVNFREQKFFSEERRLKEARNLTTIRSDVVDVIPGEYYKRGALHHFFFGKKNRDIWTTPITAKVLHLDTMSGGLKPYEIGGSQQTISVRLTDSSGRHWVLRSVNKDQQNALPKILRHSALRFMFRDQVASMNPYAPLVAASLAESADLPHLNPQLFWMPYNERHGEYNEKIAGRLVYLEEHLDTTWHHSPVYKSVIDIVDTDDMDEISQKQQTTLDTLLYLKTRLFDMLICDWDRHEDQWRWALVDSGEKQFFMPIAKDRDMALYVFDEGVFSHITLTINHKFQSFRTKVASVEGLMYQSKKLDKQILKGVDKAQFINTAKQLQQQITDVEMQRAFQLYPPKVKQQFAAEHMQILTSRLQQLTSIAGEFWKLIND